VGALQIVKATLRRLAALLDTNPGQTVPTKRNRGPGVERATTILDQQKPGCVVRMGHASIFGPKAKPRIGRAYRDR